MIDPDGRWSFGPKITNFTFVKQNWTPGGEITDGVIAYNNNQYEFWFNHDTDNANVYIAYDSDANPVFYFALYLNPLTDKMDSLVEVEE